MIGHIQALQSELVRIGFEILPPETDGNVEVEILFEDFNFHPYYGSTANPKKSYILFRDPKTKKIVAKFYTNSILQDDEVSGPMTSSFSSGFESGGGGSGWNTTNIMPIDVNAIILDWVKQVETFY
jgi:hypothetical protein